MSQTQTAPSAPFHLDQDRAILSPAQTLITKTLSPTFYEELDTEFGGFSGHTLISQFGWAEPWGVWEMHPKGDELVYLLSGATAFRLRIDGEAEVLVLNVGDYVTIGAHVKHRVEWTDGSCETIWLAVHF